MSGGHEDMRAKNRDGIVQRASWLLTGRVIGDAGLFAYYLFLARRFGASGIGDYSFAFAIASFLTLGVEFGLRDLLTRRVARDASEASEVAASVLITQAALALFLLAALLGVTRVTGYSTDLVTYLVLAFLALSLYVMGVTFTAFLEAVGAMHLSALAGLIQKAVIVVLGITLILNGASLAAVLGAHVLAGVVFLVTGWYWARREFGGFRATYRPALARTIFLAALPLLATSALWEIYARVDVIMLHSFRGETETGLYAAAYRLISAPLFMAELVGVAVFPTLVRTLVADRSEMSRVFSGTFRALAVLGLAGGVLLFTAGDELPLLLFGSEFTESGLLVRLMAPLFVIEFLMVPLWRLLLAMDRERTLLLLRLGSVGLNVGLNLLLIPAFGAMGAALTSLISEGLLFVAQLALCLRVVPSPFGGRGATLAIVALAAVAVGLAGREALPWPLAAATAAAVFGALVFAMGLVRPAEITGIIRNARPSRIVDGGDVR